MFETHIHNDYVSGGLALARVTGADYHVNADDEVAFDRTPVTDGDAIAVADTMLVQVIATPGHTFTHLSYALEDTTTGRLIAVFTGGSLLYGSTGRPDLLGPAHQATLAAAQHASARRLAQLPDDTPVCPTHGFGSFCSASQITGTQSGGTASTIGQERLANPVLRLDEQRYVAGLLACLDAYPAYYAHMGPANAAGPGGPDLTPPARADAAQLAARIAAGEWVADLRSRRGVRRRAPQRITQLRARRRLHQLPGLADPVGNPADAARRHPGAGRRGPAGPGPDRHRPAGRRCDRHPQGWGGRPAAGRPSRSPASLT